MALERQNPLPLGRYWVDVFEEDWPRFDAWLELNKHFVTVHAVENHDDEDPERRWYLFSVTAPFLVAWLGPGLPTIADTSIQSSEDTVEKPTAGLSTTEKLVFAGAIVGGAVALKYLLSGFSKGRG